MNNGLLIANQVEKNQDSVKTPELNRLKNESSKLDPSGKAELIKHLLGQDKSLQVVFGNSSITAATVYQINITNDADVSTLINAVADRMEKGDKLP